MKYIVLKDFWLRDVCLRKGQIITDPVSPRWLQLRLVGLYTDVPDTTGLTETQKETIEEIKAIEDTEKAIGDIDVSAVVDGEKIKKKRKYTKRKNTGINYIKPELSEIIVNDIN